MMLPLLGLLAAGPPADPAGSWRATLDLAGGELRFRMVVEGRAPAWRARLCNGEECQPFSAVRLAGDSLIFEMGDYAASIAVVQRGDSLIGRYHNVGSRGPRTIPFRAARGTWPGRPGPDRLLGRWDAWFLSGFDQSPRVFAFHNGAGGLEGTIISNSGDYGRFWGGVVGDSFAIAHFDGSFVYLLAGRLDGDTLRGTFHAGLRSQTPFVAVRSTGRPHLTPPERVVRADSTRPFGFAFPDLQGDTLGLADPRFRDRVVLVEIFGTWCPTCHDAVPPLVQLYRDYHRRGLEIVGIAFEVTGDTASDAPLVRRYRDKFDIPYPLLLGGTSDAETVSAAFPQLHGPIAFPTAIFLDRHGRIRRIHAGFYGPATGRQHEALLRDFRREVEQLLREQ